MISCILLTAGESVRFGSPKALAKINGIYIIDLLLEKLFKSKLGEIIIVTGAHEHLIKPVLLNHSNICIVHNKDYKFGQTSSFQTGVKSCNANSLGFMLLPVDCPFIKETTIDKLIDRFLKEPSDILIPSYQHKKGHPPIFNSTLNNKILNLTPDLGLNCLMKSVNCQIIDIDDPGITQTFNTPLEFEQIKKQ